LELPPLRERRSDIPLLAEHFLGQGSDLGLSLKSLTKEAAAALSRYDWPGNVRELGNVMQRLALLTRGREIAVDDVIRLFGTETISEVEVEGDADRRLAAAVRLWMESAKANDAAEQGDLHTKLVGLVENVVIETILERTGGNQVRAAAILGINRNTLRLKRKQ
jgi:two-component system nitrogen regulation response regulator GlnG